jgi:predicted phosphoribosyltransferase
METLFRDRADAGEQLAALLSRRLNAREPAAPLVLGLPRGGVPVAARIAEALDATLDVYVARKIGLPGNPELGVAAVAEGLPEPVLSEAGERLGVGGAELDKLADEARAGVARLAYLYRGERPPPAVAGRDVIVADDGLATGVTAEAALRGLRRQNPGRLTLAVPVCAPGTRHRLAPLADEIVCLRAPDDFSAVGQWYEDFGQTTDEEVVRLLSR